MALSSSSSASATVAVENATSDRLMSLDWPINIINSNHGQAKDVVEAVEERLQDENPKVQLLSLMLLDTMVKNCGDSVHSQIAEKKILEIMIKIVEKKVDVQVTEKILVLLDSWQEAFGGPGGKHPQYYNAYVELRHSGVEFPKRSSDAAPVFTPPVAHPTPILAQLGYGMPSNSARRLDETIATETESLSLPSMEVIWNSMKLLSDMLQAMNPSDPAAVKNEVIVNLVESCRSSQIKLVQVLATTGNEELLCLGPDLNDYLLSVLAKYDAIASGACVFVIGPQYCDPSTVQLEIRRDGQSTSTFVVRDVNGDVIFRVHREKSIMPSGVLFDRDGNPVVLIKKQIATAHGRWAVYKGKNMEESILIFCVRRPTMIGEKTKLDVFLAINEKEKVRDFWMEESQSEKLPIIYSGESPTKVAEMYKVITRGISPSEEITMVKIYPNIDRAFIVTLIAIYEWIKETGENRKKVICRTAKYGVEAALVVGTHFLLGGGGDGEGLF